MLFAVGLTTNFKIFDLIVRNVFQLRMFEFNLFHLTMENTWKYYLLKSFCFALIQRVFIVSLLFLDIHAFFFVNATVYKFKDETFKISLYFDFFFKSSKGWQWNQKGKNYIQQRVDVKEIQKRYKIEVKKVPTYK